MIPLRDSEASRRLTPANTLLLIASIVVFAREVQLGALAEPALMRFAMVPAQIARIGAGSTAVDVRVIATLVTSLFIHASGSHLAGNLLYLFIFGPAVEERIGHVRFVLFYLASGIVAGLAMVAMGPDSHIPVIGASGAIAGILGAYFVLYPRGRILTILPVFVFVQFVEIRAVFYLLIWFAVQLYSGIAAGARGPLVGGVAWWAHVGGFLFGVAIAPILARSGAGANRRRR